MSNSVIKLAVVVGMAWAVAGLCLAGEQAKGQTITVKGIVSVTWDEDWNPTVVTVKDTTKRPAVVYLVTLDAKSVDLANEMEGAEAEIVAVMTEDKAEKTKTLTVKSFKAAKDEMQEPEEAAEEEAPKEEGAWELPADDEGGANW